ncbi:hypothetical protein J7J90_00225 [Candidatus Micrarchaeota archaeon]|nr:hypothetical protein [Candidatus Micrarchaeota archaeon]
MGETFKKNNKNGKKNYGNENSKNHETEFSSSKDKQTKEQLLYDLKYGNDKEKVMAASQLIDMLSKDVKDETTWQLIKELVGLLIEEWAIGEIKTAVEKIKNNNQAQRNWGETQAYIVGKMAYEMIERLNNEQTERKNRILGELLKRAGKGLLKLISKPFTWLFDKIVSLFKKKEKVEKKDAEELIEQIKEDPKEAWNRITNMDLEDALALFEQTDVIFSEENIDIPQPEQVDSEMLTAISDKLETLYASAPDNLKKIDTESLANNIEKIV